MKHFLITAFFIFSLSKICVCNEHLRITERDILDGILDPDRYDGRIGPNSYGLNGTDGSPGNPVLITVNYLLRDVESIDERRGEWTVQLTFRQTWTDGRLRFNHHQTGGHFAASSDYVILPPGEVGKVWRPDTFFKEERRSHLHHQSLTGEPRSGGNSGGDQLMRIHVDGTVLLSARVTLTLACPMDLRHFPFDVQYCSIGLASFGHTADELEYRWKEGPSPLPVQVSEGLFDGDSLPFTLERHFSRDCSSQTSTGKYSCLATDFVLRRSFPRFRAHLPAVLFVLASFTGFWLTAGDQKSGSITARTIVVFGSLLGLVWTLSNQDASFAPVVKGGTKFDRWNNVSLAFIFAALLELVIVSYLESVKKFDSSLSESQQQQQRRYKLVQTVQNLVNWGSRLDVVARIAFPVVYLVFLGLYFFTGHYQFDQLEIAPNN